MAANTYQMLALAHVVREGSISGAARQMGVTQSAVSQHLAKLERKVGAQVLLRSREGIVLTPMGQELFQLADQFASLDQQITERLRGHAALDRGHLTVIANAPQPALGLIERYANRFPRISVDFALFDWASAMERLRDKRVDIGIVTEPTKMPDLYVQPVHSARYVVYARSDHPLAKRDKVSLAEVAQFTLLLPEKGSLTQRIVTDAFLKSSIQPKRIVTMTTFPVMKEAILQGIGVGIFLEASSVAEHRLQEIPITELDQVFETCLAVPRHKTGLRIIKSFLETVDETLL